MNNIINPEINNEKTLKEKLKNLFKSKKKKDIDDLKSVLDKDKFIKY